MAAAGQPKNHNEIVCIIMPGNAPAGGRQPGRPLSLADQPLISSICSGLNIELSEYNFANLYLFRQVHHYRILSVRKDLFAILGRSYDSRVFFMPLYAPEDWAACVVDALSAGADYIFPIPEAQFEKLRQSGLAVSYRADDSDYMYEAESIRTYAGRHLDGQRNFVRRLLEQHTVTMLPLTQQTQDKALFVLHAWAANKAGNSDTGPCQEAIVLAETLGLDGYIYEVDDHPAGLLLGGPLTADTYLFHFAKNLSAYRGLTKFCYHDVAQRIAPKFRFLNWEQDLGIEGLRNAKTSFHPAFRAKKGFLAISPEMDSPPVPAATH